MNEENILEQSFGKNNDNLIKSENNLAEQKNNLILSKQLKNYQNQILVLTKRIKEYEQDLINKNSKEESQMNDFMKIELNYKNELNEKNKQISSLIEENKFLKEQLNNMENNVDLLKTEVKDLILLNKENKERKENININPKETINMDWNEDNNNDLLDLIKKYSEEISNLKKQNEVLLNTINNQNINSKKNNNMINYKILNNNESLINNFSTEINNEIYIISRWIETYLVCEFNKDFEVPPLINEEEIINNKLNTINFKLLKKSLENAKTNLDNLINKKETEIIELENILNEKELKYKEIKNEFFEIKKKLYDANNEKEELNKKIEQSEKDWENNNKNMGNIKLILNKEKENKIIYLKNLYSIVNKEINNILQDINFKPYHNKLIENKELDLEEKEINLEEKILNSLNKLIIFLDELKYDYIQTKKENYEIIKQKANDNYKILKNENDYNIYKNELDEYKVQIDKLINENKILKEEIEINSQNNKMKELNDYNFKDINSEEMKQQIIELKDNNNQLIRKLRDVNDGNYELEQKNNVLENEMGKLKGYEQMLEQLKEKYDNLSFDYQRIQRENSSLKNLINNNQ